MNFDHGPIGEGAGALMVFPVFSKKKLELLLYYVYRLSVQPEGVGNCMLVIGEISSTAHLRNGIIDLQQ